MLLNMLLNMFPATCERTLTMIFKFDFFFVEFSQPHSSRFQRCEVDAQNIREDTVISSLVSKKEKDE